MKNTLIALTLLVLLSLALPGFAQGNDPTLIGTVVFPVVTLREGPGNGFAAVAQAAQGEELAVVGRTTDGAWYLVALEGDEQGWLADYLVQLNGPSSSLPIADFQPVSTELYVPPGCDYFGIGPFFGRTGQSIILTQGWEAASRDLVDDYLSSVIQIVSFDGRLISTYSAYASEIFFDETRGTWRIFWSFNMGPVAAGEHYIEWSMMFNRQITDGLDGNGDGQPDTYGPQIMTSGCTLIIE